MFLTPDFLHLVINCVTNDMNKLYRSLKSVYLTISETADLMKESMKKTKEDLQAFEHELVELMKNHNVSKQQQRPTIS